MAQGDLSYHDVTVYVGDVAYKPSRNYALRLTCTKAGGWNLWKVWDNKEELLGGEFESQKGAFCIEVAGMVIVGERPAEITQPASFGWTGGVENSASGVTFSQK